ncbi:alpha/beta-hydrolase [Epithele typhae]|uniref:alpha/beta-hydrolase n=1 Tax=Epithele typhae TaxID=378194 RepID=UPI002008784A|nr:alpha/beta-hydrolase [Epithele typhae]KAH9933634.1 alpha/beta-hydrolase [Epithele typhae]
MALKRAAQLGLVFLGAIGARTAALPSPLANRANSIAALTDSQVAVFKPYSYYATTGYCMPNTTITWSCGKNCDANPDFKPVASGGNGKSVQRWYVGYDPHSKEVIVSHQGTDPSQFEQILVDADIGFQNLNSTLFPGVSKDVMTHSGFSDAQEKAATEILAAVKKTMSMYGTNKVVATGHSLGAAISLLDAVYFHINLPQASVRFIGYGVPRVGNDHWADYVDAAGFPVTHVNNKQDIVPTLPYVFLGFHHPSGEIHIVDPESWLSCPGQDNNDKLCSKGAVPNLFVGVADDHAGPYDGVTMGQDTCDD